MPRNVEVKARIDDLPALRKQLAALPIAGQDILDQTDTFFHVGDGRLKLREFAQGPAELIFYRRPDSSGAKLSHYDRLSCHDPATLKRILTQALGVRGTVKKRREVYFVGPTRIHLDTVEGLGTFLELEVVLQDSDAVEAGEAIASEVLRALQVTPDSLLPGAYIDLLEVADRRSASTDTGTPAVSEECSLRSR
jgi:predicted adenylyl cyclase CyaB